MIVVLLCLEVQNIEKLEKVVNDGNYYGAQQMYKSVSARFTQFLTVPILQEKCTLSTLYSSLDLRCEMLLQITSS